jgi:hypothetical protein
MTGFIDVYSSGDERYRDSHLSWLALERGDHPGAAGTVDARMSDSRLA